MKTVTPVILRHGQMLDVEVAPDGCHVESLWTLFDTQQVIDRLDDAHRSDRR